MALPDLKSRFVDPFPKSKTRWNLYSALEELLQMFLTKNIPCEFWVDGSFLTEKLDPSDVDLVVRLDHDVSNSLTAEQQTLVNSANEAEFIKGVDSFVFVAFPRDHILFGSEGDERETWAEQFGLEHSEQWCKGLAIIRLGETRVGLRIRR